MTGSESFRFGVGGVSGAPGVGVAFFDCASFRDSRLNVQSSILYLVSVLEEALEEEGGDVFGAALLKLVAAGEGEEGPPEDGQAVAGLGDGGEEEAELGPSTTLRINSLGGATSVLEGPPEDGQAVEVAPGCSGAGAGAAAARRALFGGRV